MAHPKDHHRNRNTLKDVGETLFVTELSFLQSLRHSRSLQLFLVVSLALLGGFTGFLLHMAAQHSA